MRSFIKVLISNFWVMLMGVLITLIIPKYLGPVQYGYYQLYVFYASFLGIFLLGFCDGIYLKYGGVEYEKLDIERFGRFFNFLFVYLTGLSAMMYLVLRYFNSNYQNMALLLSITLFLQGLNSFFVLINQASGRFNVYSIANILEKSFLLIYAMIVFITGEINLNFLFSFTIMGKFLTLFINVLLDYSLVSKIFIPPLFPSRKQILENIRIGFPLTIAGVVSMLMTGVGKNKVQGSFGVREFGYYSLIFSMMSIISQIIAAVSIVFYPMLKKQSVINMKRNLIISDYIFEYLNILFPLSFYCIYILLYFYLPNYLPATNALIILLPTLFYQSKISVVYNTFFKVLRMETKILKNGVLSLVFCLIGTFLGFFLYPTVETIAFCTLFSFVFWEMCSRRSLSKMFNISTKLLSVGNIYFIIYIFMALYLPIFISFLGYFILVTSYLYANRKHIYLNIKVILSYRSKVSGGEVK